MERKKQLMELMNIVYNPLGEVSAGNGIMAIVNNMSEYEAYKHWFKLKKWAKENYKLPKSEKVIINDFARYLLTTEKEFVYVSFSGSMKLMKRNKILSKFFRNDRLDDFVYVTEDKDAIYFADGSSDYACTYMDDDLV